MHILLSYSLGLCQRRLNFCLMILELYKFKLFLRWTRFSHWLFDMPQPEYVDDWDQEIEDARWDNCWGEDK